MKINTHQDQEIANIFDQFQRGNPVASEKLKNINKSQITIDNSSKVNSSFHHKSPLKAQSVSQLQSIQQTLKKLPRLKYKIKKNTKLTESKSFSAYVHEKVKKSTEATENKSLQKSKTNKKTQQLNSQEDSQNSQKKKRRKLKAIELRKHYNQLLQINQQQKKLQTEIMNIHRRAKYKLQNCQYKYQINPIDITTEANDDISINKQFTKLIKKSKLLKEEEIEINKLYNSIDQINSYIATQKAKLLIAQQQISQHPFLPFTSQMQEIVEDQQSQRSESPKQQTNPAETYNQMMREMRKKKWSLNQRFNYQKSLSKLTNVDSQVTQHLDKSPENGQNKVIVNARLKKFLFD